MKTSGSPPAAGQLEPGGHRHQQPLVHDRELGLGAAADDRHHARARLEAGRFRPERDDLARQLHPGDVLGIARRRRVQAALLHHVAAVQARRPHPHEHLFAERLGVGMLLDHDLLVADRGGAHGASLAA